MVGLAIVVGIILAALGLLEGDGGATTRRHINHAKHLWAEEKERKLSKPKRKRRKS